MTTFGGVFSRSPGDSELQVHVEASSASLNLSLSLGLRHDDATGSANRRPGPPRTVMLAQTISLRGEKNAASFTRDSAPGSS